MSAGIVRQWKPTLPSHRTPWGIKEATKSLVRRKLSTSIFRGRHSRYGARGRATRTDVSARPSTYMACAFVHLKFCDGGVVPGGGELASGWWIVFGCQEVFATVAGSRGNSAFPPCSQPNILFKYSCCDCYLIVAILLLVSNANSQNLRL